MNNEPSQSQHDLSARDAELARRLAQTLDESVDALDVQTRERLVLMRHRALSHSKKPRIAASLAVAASLLAIAAMPWMLQSHIHSNTAANKPLADDSAYLSVDPEMLADMDMLQAVGETQ